MTLILANSTTLDKLYICYSFLNVYSPLREEATMTLTYMPFTYKESTWVGNLDFKWNIG